MEQVLWLYGVSRSLGTHIEKASWVPGKLLRPSAHNLGKNRKKPCNKLFASALKRLVGQRRLVQIYLPGRGGQSFHASTLEERIGKKARRGRVCVRGKRSPRETFERRTIIKIPCQLKMAGSFLWTYGLHTLQGV